MQAERRGLTSPWQGKSKGESRTNVGLTWGGENVVPQGKQTESLNGEKKKKGLS